MLRTCGVCQPKMPRPRNGTPGREEVGGGEPSTHAVVHARVRMRQHTGGMRGRKLTEMGPARPAYAGGAPSQGPASTNQKGLKRSGRSESMGTTGPRGQTRRPPGFNNLTRLAGTLSHCAATAMASKRRSVANSQALATSKVHAGNSAGVHSRMSRSACSTWRWKTSMACTWPSRARTIVAITAVRKPVPQPTSNTLGGAGEFSSAGAKSCAKTMYTERFSKTKPPCSRWATRESSRKRE
mmetsp:Transcript_43793/g.136310  ORF Transcript_43793/g.136310 Transcript_43793/m.136310 type:complete len:240 (+) Transcript_43793:191-910(+)